MKKGHIPVEMYLKQHCCQTVSHTATNKSCGTEAQNSLPLHTTNKSCSTEAQNSLPLHTTNKSCGTEAQNSLPLHTTNKSCGTEAQNSLPLHTTLGKKVMKNILKFQDKRCAHLAHRSMESTCLPAPNVQFATMTSDSHKHRHENDSTSGILQRK